MWAISYFVQFLCINLEPFAQNWPFLFEDLGKGLIDVCGFELFAVIFDFFLDGVGGGEIFEFGIDEGPPAQSAAAEVKIEVEHLGQH